MTDAAHFVYRSRPGHRFARPAWLCGLGALLIAMLGAQAAPPPDIASQEQITAVHKEVQDLIGQRQRLDRLLWGPELTAQEYEARFSRLWDDLLRNPAGRFAILGDFPFKTLVLGKHASGEPLELNIARYRFTAGGQRLTPEQWRKFLADTAKNGYEIAQTEWHHSKFVPPTAGKPAESTVSAVLHVAREQPAHRVIIRAELHVVWAKQISATDPPAPDTITVRSMELLEREQPPAFREVFRLPGAGEKPLIHPVLVYDLDQDGLSEIVVGGQNIVVWNRGNGKFEVEPFLKDARSMYDGAVLADFTGDGHVDYVAVDTEGYPLLFAGDAQGRFEKPGRRMADTHLGFPKTLTAGDIDGDDDLDLFIANYKYAYRQGQYPTPYYDANDGYPAYLLRNDGGGVFTDITEPSGLAGKRFRRTYTSSFVDLDDDQDLDLIVVSDYAGFDTYLNDGTGRFQDVSDFFGADRHFFGMGHTFADYDGDGKLDFYVIGMSSTTAKRLERMGLGRDDKPEHTAMRSAMGYGNRMFLRRKDGFVRAPFNDQVARTGWSWGASSFDFDNDGDKDIFVANGHYSGRSTQDYCTTFWRHDIYTDGTKPNLARDVMFQAESSALRNADISWNGYEHKVLMMNRGGEEFVNVAFLLGVSFEYDGRGVVADDLDADGRVDLLVVEFKTEGLDRNRYTLHVYQNVLDQSGHWVGIRLRDHPNGYSPIGATVTVKSAKGLHTTKVVTGDSFSTQHSSTVHFGLGEETAVESIEVRWRNGTVNRLQQPAANQYHTIDPPVPADAAQQQNAPPDHRDRS